MVILRSSPVILIASATRLLLVANNDPAVATKVASSGGITGTLLGTLIPLLPPYLPLIVVGLIIVRRPFLAAVAAGAMILVSPAQITWDWWLHGAHGVVPWWQSIQLQGWHKLVADIAMYLRNQEWPIWVACVAGLCAAASAPNGLRRVEDEKLMERVEEQLKRVLDGWAEEIRSGERDFFKVKIGRKKFFLPKESLSEDDFYVQWRRPLLEKAQQQRRNKPLWRVLWSIALGAIAVPLVGLVMQFYTIPIIAVNPGILARSMWLPSEVITVKEQPQPTVGYVLSTSDGWFVVLTERNRAIEYIPADKVTARSVCAADENHMPSGRPLVRLYGASNTVSPQCPSTP
jgi:hypothetical protein